MEHQEHLCLHDKPLALWMFISVFLLLLLFFMVIEILDNLKEYPYYHKWFKELKNRKFILDGKVATSTVFGYNQIVFDLESGIIDCKDFTLLGKFPEFLDLYHFFWWSTYWHYFHRHIKPTLKT